MTSSSDTDALHTPLYDLHQELGGRMVAFAGYALPIQYETGALKEHLFTRTSGGLFDVSHMGQVRVRPRSGELASAALALERLVPADILGLALNRQRYSVLTNEEGGILDDLMIANLGDSYFLVVNAACKTQDIDYLKSKISDTCEIVVEQDRALLALQGPAAQEVISELAPAAANMTFMEAREMDLAGAHCTVARSGYTGEDGFEIGVPADQAERLARLMLATDRVAPIGLGARDSLRLEAGLCLYGSDMDEAASPVEASLEWSIQKVRRPGGQRAGGYPGASRIARELERGPSRRRVGLRPDGRAPIRAGVHLFRSATASEPVGVITSGGFSPSLSVPVAMGYVPADSAKPGETLFAEVRGARISVTVSETPFVRKTYKR